MPKFSEDTFDTWRRPPSDNEENKLTNAQKQVKDAICDDKFLSKISLEIFGQGSYANDTNVRLNSDIDINVMYKDEEYFQIPYGKNREDFGIELSDKLKFSDFKTYVENALVSTFGRANVVPSNKCIKVLASPTRVQCDVVPTFLYRRYEEDKSSVLGIKFFSDTNESVVGFPKQHIANAIEKNKATGRSYKRVTRIFRKLRYRLKDEGIPIPDSITSFLLECLIWNVPNHIFNDEDNWTNIVKESIRYIYHKTKTSEDCKNWGEVSELLYLFHSKRKWSFEDVNNYMKILWHYLEFE